MAVSTAIDASAVARVLGIKTQYKNLRGGRILYLPQRIAVIGQGSTTATYSTDKAQVFSAAEVGSTYGFGSPLHLAALQLLPSNGDGVGSIPVTVYPLEDDGAGVAAAGSITPVGTATAATTGYVTVSNIRSEAFAIATTDTVATLTAKITTAINAVLEMPVVAVDNSTDVGLTAKWKGSSGNDLVVEIAETVASGFTYGITQPTAGATNPDVQPALDQIGEVWETMVVNCLEVADTTALDAYSTFGEGRWGALTHKPLIVFTGNADATIAAATAVSDARATDRVNAQLVAPASNDLPLVICARQVARIAPVANNNPPKDYAGQKATGLVPGPDGDQWNYVQRDAAVKAGSSTIEVRDGVVNLSDTVTMYHPTGEPNPAYRYVSDVVRIQNIIFNLNLIFQDEGWAGAPLIPDDQAVVNPAARQPKAARAAVNVMIDNLALDAILSDPETAKSNTVAVISDSNPNRLDVSLTVQLSGNSTIISVDLNFGFYFGTLAAA